MKYKLPLAAGLVCCGVIFSACGAATNVADQTPNAVNAAGRAAATPTKSPAPTANLSAPEETIKTFYKALIDRDETALRRTVAAATLTEFDRLIGDEEVQKAGVNSLTAFLIKVYGEIQSLPEIGEARIDGDKAVIEVKGVPTTTHRLVREGDEWKLVENQKERRAAENLRGGAAGKTAKKPLPTVQKDGDK